MTLWKQALSRKTIEHLLEEMAGEHRLHRVLGPGTLTSLGIGSVIGAGIFVTVGRAAKLDAGPAVVLSFMVAAVGCALAALCYAEFAAATPVAGSAYTYAYVTLGELFAWIIGWDLILEYAMSCATVASASAGYLNEFLRAAGLPMVPKWLGSHPFATEVIEGAIVRPWMNLPAALLVAACTALLVLGIRESASANGVLVLLKLCVVLFVIGLGWQYVDAANWNQHPVSQRIGAAETTLAAQPPTLLRYPLAAVDERIRSPFFPYGLSGVFAGASIVFFAYIGFDAISTHAEEARRPQRDVPLAILATLGICTLLYVLVAVVITGMVPYYQLDTSAPLAAAFAERNAQQPTWGLRVSTLFIAAGGLAGTTSVLLVTFLSQARIFLAMARDGLLPPLFAEVHPRFQTPHLATLLTGLVIAVTAAWTPIEKLEEMVNIGTFLAFVVVCAAVLLLRIQRPDAKRPFRCPAVWVVAPAGIVVNLTMMDFLPWDTWLRLFVWLALGLVLYFGYGRRHSRLGQRLWQEFREQGLSPSDAPLPRA